MTFVYRYLNYNLFVLSLYFILYKIKVEIDKYRHLSPINYFVITNKDELY